MIDDRLFAEATRRLRGMRADEDGNSSAAQLHTTTQLGWIEGLHDIAKEMEQQAPDLPKALWRWGARLFRSCKAEESAIMSRSIDHADEMAMNIDQFEELFKAIHAADQGSGPVEPPVEPPAGGEWIVSHLNGHELYMRAEGGGATRADSLGAIYNVLGGDRNSSSGRNRPLLADPGDTILVRPGHYRHFRVTRTWKEGDVPITVQGTPGETFIKRNPVGGSTSHYWEWGHKFHLKDVVILPSDRAGIGTERPSASRWGGRHPGLAGFELEDVEIRGSWDWQRAHPRDAAQPTKWGFFAWELEDFLATRVRVTGIDGEHAFYMHNPIGDMALVDWYVRGCARSAVQFTNRPHEGAKKHNGTVTLTGWDVADVGLQQGGGAHAINWKGHLGHLIVRDCTVKQGANPNLHPEVQDNITGCLIAHGASGGLYNESVDLVSGEFVMGVVLPGAGSARRPCVDISWTHEFTLRKDMRIISGPGAREALRLQPGTIDKIRLSRQAHVQGACYWGPQRYQTYQQMLAAVQSPKLEVMD